MQRQRGKGPNDLKLSDAECVAQPMPCEAEASDVTRIERSLQRLVRRRSKNGIWLDFSEYDWEPLNNRSVGFEIIYGSTNWDGRKIAGVFIANTGSGLHPDTLVCEKTGQSVDGSGGASVPDNNGVSYWAKHAKIAVETGNIDREVLERSKLAALNGSKDVGFHGDVIESPNDLKLSDDLCVARGLRKQNS